MPAALMRAHWSTPTGTMRASAVVGCDGDGDAEVGLGVAVGEADRVGAALVGAAVVGPGAGGEVVHAVSDAAHARAAAPTHQDMTRRTRPGYVAGARAPVSRRPG